MRPPTEAAYSSSSPSTLPVLGFTKWTRVGHAKAGDSELVYVIVVIHFLGGEALNLLAGVRAAI